MKKPKTKEMTLRLNPADAQQIKFLAEQCGWTETAVIRQMIRTGFAATARDEAARLRLHNAFIEAINEHKIRQDCERRIAELKNHKPKGTR